MSVLDRLRSIMDEARYRQYARSPTRSFTDVADPGGRAIKSQLHYAAKHSKADSLLRKFSWEKDQ